MAALEYCADCNAVFFMTFAIATFIRFVIVQLVPFIAAAERAGWCTVPALGF